MRNSINSRVLLLLNLLFSSAIEKKRYFFLSCLHQSLCHKKDKGTVWSCASSEQEISRDVLQKPRGRVAKRRDLIQLS